MENRPKLIGISASLRNARWGSQDLPDSLRALSSKEELFSFLKTESELHLENFLKAGRKSGESFLEIYKKLKRNTGKKGLSNSEVLLSAALWAAHHGYNIDIEHVSLCEYFPASGKPRKINELKNRILASKGILVSSPVYFGDRSSVAQSLLNVISRDVELRAHLKGKVYAGISVGAKRNGGQETTLIYQMLDYLRCGLLGVGNDTDTTSQYGGTGHAGDVGSMYKDSYGLETSMGTGRRIGDLICRLNSGKRLNDSLKVLFLILQDRNNEALRRTEDMFRCFEGQIEPTVIDITKKNIRRCLACDFCPSSIGKDEAYRCVIASDDFRGLHTKLLSADMIVPVMLSVKDTEGLIANYQVFLERTRYLRRGDYALSNLLINPLIFEEVGYGENYSLRLITSFMRHNTVIGKPILAYLNNGSIINENDVHRDLETCIANGKAITVARYAEAGDVVKYKPIGYVLSANKEEEDQRLEKREEAVKSRHQRFLDESERRLEDDI